MGYRAKVQQTVSIGEIADGILINLLGGQNLAGERLLALSSAKAPMDDEGTLVASGTVNPATTPGDETEVVFDTPYAARWHEDGALIDSLGRHYSGGSNFQNGRQSHYLSEPAEQNKDELVQIIRKAGRGG